MISHTYYWVRKLQARYFARDISAALYAEARAQTLLPLVPPGVELAEYHFYAALSLAASLDASQPAPRAQLEAIAAHHQKLAGWAVTCPDNFDNRAALVGAEIARFEGRDLEAMRLYDQAIRSAQIHGFLHHEALAYEPARPVRTRREPSRNA